MERFEVSILKNLGVELSGAELSLMKDRIQRELDGEFLECSGIQQEFRDGQVHLVFIGTPLIVIPKVPASSLY